MPPPVQFLNLTRRPFASAIPVNRASGLPHSTAQNTIRDRILQAYADYERRAAADDAQGPATS